MISAVQWVRRGVARREPLQYEITPEELEALQKSVEAEAQFHGAVTSEDEEEDDDEEEQDEDAIVEEHDDDDDDEDGGWSDVDDVDAMDEDAPAAPAYDSGRWRATARPWRPAS